MRHSRSAAAARRSRRLFVAGGLGALTFALGGAGLLWRASPALTAADVGMVADAALAPEAGRDAEAEPPAPPDASAEVVLRPDASARPRPARPDAPKLPPPPRPNPGHDAGHAGAPDGGKGRLEADKVNPFLAH